MFVEGSTSTFRFPGRLTLGRWDDYGEMNLVDVSLLGV